MYTGSDVASLINRSLSLFTFLPCDVDTSPK